MDLHYIQFCRSGNTSFITRNYIIFNLYLILSQQLGKEDKIGRINKTLKRNRQRILTAETFKTDHLKGIHANERQY